MCFGPDIYSEKFGDPARQAIFSGLVGTATTVADSPVSRGVESGPYRCTALARELDPTQPESAVLRFGVLRQVRPPLEQFPVVDRTTQQNFPPLTSWDEPPRSESGCRPQSSGWGDLGIWRIASGRASRPTKRISFLQTNPRSWRDALRGESRAPVAMPLRRLAAPLGNHLFLPLDAGPTNCVAARTIA